VPEKDGEDDSDRIHLIIALNLAPDVLANHTWPAP
jgi:hypothetical protein